MSQNNKKPSKNEGIDKALRENLLRRKRADNEDFKKKIK